jgi:hypothetical protein
MPRGTATTSCWTYRGGRPTEILLRSLVPQTFAFPKPTRLIQIGESAGAGLFLAAESLRTSGVEIYSAAKGLNAQTMGDVYGQIVAWAQSGELTFDVVKVPLSDIETAWQRSDLWGSRLVVCGPLHAPVKLLTSLDPLTARRSPDAVSSVAALESRAHVNQARGPPVRQHPAIAVAGAGAMYTRQRLDIGPATPPPDEAHVSGTLPRHGRRRVFAPPPRASAAAGTGRRRRGTGSRGESR